MNSRFTQIKLYKNTMLDRSSEDTMFFESKSAQNSYFASKLFLTINGAMYQRENRNSVRVEAPISGCLDVDYISFNNDLYENKTFYCFVTGVNYINDNLTEITYEVDYMQTWLIEYKNSIRPCFVEREHARTDLELNTIEDSLELGDYKINNASLYKFSSLDEFVVMMEATFDTVYWCSDANDKYLERGKRMPPIKSAGRVIRYSDIVAFNAAGFAEFMAHVNVPGTGVTQEDIMCIWLYPKNLLDLTHYTMIAASSTEASRGYIYWNLQPLKVEPTVNLSVTNFEGYYPKNKKLLQAPFAKVLVSNNGGSATDYNIEYFNNRELTFSLFGELGATAKVRLVPLNYKNLTGSSYDLDEALDSIPFPQIQIIGDSYTIWLAQNRNTVNNNFAIMEAERVRGGVNFVAGGVGTAMGGNASAGVTGVNTSLGVYNQFIGQYEKISSMIAQSKDAQLRPATASGVNNASLNAYWDKIGFNVSIRTIDKKHAETIDSYYTMFGYPVKALKVPSLNNREVFTYVKTNGIKIEGNIPVYAKEVIENRFNSGVRFWKSNLGNYSVSNRPLDDI